MPPAVCCRIQVCSFCFTHFRTTSSKGLKLYSGCLGRTRSCCRASCARFFSLLVFFIFFFLWWIKRYTYSVEPIEVVDFILHWAGSQPCPKVHYLSSSFFRPSSTVNEPGVPNSCGVSSSSSRLSSSHVSRFSTMHMHSSTSGLMLSATSAALISL